MFFCLEMCFFIVMNEIFFGFYELELVCWEKLVIKIVLLLFFWKKLLYEVVNIFLLENSIYFVGIFFYIELCI